MRKKGVTLIELVVAMGIFTVLSTMVVGAYVSISRTKIISANMRESQQKIRIATETISRLSRQAEGVTSTGSTLRLDFPSSTFVIFTISGTTLTYQACPLGTCTAPTTLIDGINTRVNSGSFGTISSSYPTPLLPLNLQFITSWNTPYANTSNINTTIPLEGLK